MEKLREERFEERRKAMKLSIKEFINGRDDVNIKTEPSIKDNLEQKNENDDDKDENMENDD